MYIEMNALCINCNDGRLYIKYSDHDIIMETRVEIEI
jgi:hypothetical protein